MVKSLLDTLAQHPEQVNGVVAFFALLVSLLSIILTVVTIYFQRQHNYKSVTPVASFPLGDYEGRITVRLKNTGIGPLMVESLRVTDGVEEKRDVISWMPGLPEGVDWDTFYGAADGACIPTGESLVLLQLKGNADSQDFAGARDACRKALAVLTVSVVYKDIYGRRMPLAVRDLSWFGRHWPWKVT